MKRHAIVTVAVALAVLVGMIAPAAAMAQPAATQSVADDGIQALQETNQTQNATETENATETPNATENDSVPPGARLAGAFGVQKAEIRGAVDQRAFGLEVAAAASNDSKAQVLARTSQRLDERLQTIEQRRQQLEAARQNGSMDQWRYQVRMSEVAAESANLRTLANATGQTAESLPADVLEANGVNATAIEQLRTRASNLSGPEVAHMARSIAGNAVGQPLGPPSEMPMGQPEERPGTQNETPGGQGQHGQGGHQAGNNTTVTTMGSTNATMENGTGLPNVENVTNVTTTSQADGSDDEPAPK